MSAQCCRRCCSTLLPASKHIHIVPRNSFILGPNRYFFPSPACAPSSSSPASPLLPSSPLPKGEKQTQVEVPYRRSLFPSSHSCLWSQELDHSHPPGRLRCIWVGWVPPLMDRSIPERCVLPVCGSLIETRNTGKRFKLPPISDRRSSVNPGMPAWWQRNIMCVPFGLHSERGRHR